MHCLHMHVGVHTSVCIGFYNEKKIIIVVASIGQAGAQPRATRSSEFQSEDEFFSLFPGSDTGVARNFSCLQSVFQSAENAAK